MIEIPGLDAVVAFGDAEAPPPDWRSRLNESEGGDSDDATPERRAEVSGMLGLDLDEVFGSGRGDDGEDEGEGESELPPNDSGLGGVGPSPFGAKSMRNGEPVGRKSWFAELRWWDGPEHVALRIEDEDWEEYERILDKIRREEHVEPEVIRGPLWSQHSRNYSERRQDRNNRQRTAEPHRRVLSRDLSKSLSHDSELKEAARKHSEAVAKYRLFSDAYYRVMGGHVSMREAASEFSVYGDPPKTKPQMLKLVESAKREMQEASALLGRLYERSQRKSLIGPSPFLVKRFRGVLFKAVGTCKQGERSDLTGCTPASGDPSARKQSTSRESSDVSPSAKKRMDSVRAKIMNAPTTKPSCCLHAPTTEQLKPSKDGPAKSARVGVPADSVPPPPNEIPRLPNLDPEQREVESRYADAYLADPQLAVDKYLKALRKRKVGEYPNVFATDDVKMLNRDWNPGKARQGEELPDESKRAMSKYNTAVHQTANAIAKRAFLQYLDDELMEGPPEKRTVLVTNGGCAAGKGSSLRRAGEGEGDYKGTLPAADQVGAIWDAAGEQNATENEWILEECKKRGIKATFAYVWADPKDTWEAEDRGVVRRAMRKGRMVDAKLFADSYAMGAKNMKAFSDKHAGEADFIFLDNRVKGKPKLLDSFPEETLSWESDEIEQMALSSLERNADNLSKPLLKGGLYGTKIWS